MDKKLLQKYVEGSITAEEVETVVDWLDADEKHVKEFMTLHKLYDISILNQSTQGRKKEKVARTVFRRIVIELLKVAAIALILFSGNFLLQKDDQMESLPSFQTLYVPAGQRAELILPDSTKVWLNANSKLVYPSSFKEGIRQVELDGEAYFDVRHNGDNPFVVRTKSMNVTVLGTEFNVSAYSGIEEFNIALLRGSVELNSPDLSRKYRMTAGEQVLYRDGKYVSDQIGSMDYFKWKEGLLSFNNQPIHVIIEKLRLYYDIRIEVADLPFLKERYSGKFRVKDGIEQVLKVLQLEHKFTYVKDNELNLITIK
ncbi:FecR family protein [Parabacteroides hominis]|uniref:FecR domain-containing protein n=1 Tax=Parabacteroides hominis TaxID=2763057 RepID=A0ABR7DT27_9BACT|nr:FecR domain-containing protein [Parabacteroides hominis]MBC5634604.1 FecR domain-containing protein [Parabacteroides hominis]